MPPLQKCRHAMTDVSRRHARRAAEADLRRVHDNLLKCWPRSLRVLCYLAEQQCNTPRNCKSTHNDFHARLTWTQWKLQ